MLEKLLANNAPVVDAGRCGGVSSRCFENPQRKDATSDVHFDTAETKMHIHADILRIIESKHMRIRNKAMTLTNKRGRKVRSDSRFRMMEVMEKSRNNENSNHVEPWHCDSPDRRGCRKDSSNK